MFCPRLESRGPEVGGSRAPPGEPSGAKPGTDDGEHARAGGRIRGVPLAAETAGEQGFHVGEVGVGSHRAGLLGTLQEAAPGPHDVVGAVGRGGLEVESGAREGVDDAAVRRALLDHEGEEGEEGFAGFLVLGQGARKPYEVFHAVQQDRLEQRFLGGEVPAHGAGADPGAAGDLMDRDRQPLRREDVGRHFQDPCPVPLGVGAQWSLSVRVCGGETTGMAIPYSRSNPDGRPDSMSDLAILESETAMRTVTIGSTGLEVSALGLGCVGLSEFYGPTERSGSLAALRTAADLGVTFLDTSDYYGVDFANERLIGEFLAQVRRSEITVATKFGAVRAPGTGELTGVRSDPPYVRAACDASLRHLGVEYIDLYYLHHPDFTTPVEETVGAMAELVAAGKVRHIGLSNVSADQLRAGHHVHPIAAVQNEWSLFTREYENSVVPVCAELGIGFVAYSPFSRGFLTGRHTSTEGLAEDDTRRVMPRFQSFNAEHNATLLAPVRRIAEARDATMAQIALAWLFHRPAVHGISVVPLPGTRSPVRLAENVDALGITLTDEELLVLDPIAAQVWGARMPPAPDLD